MSPLPFLSLRYWRQRRWRGATTVAGVALGVALLVSVGLLHHSVVRAYRSLSAALAGGAQLELRAHAPGGLEAGWLERVRAVDGVAGATPLLEVRAFLLVDGHKLPILLRGVDAATQAQRPLLLDAGRPPAADAAAELLLAAPLFRSLGLLLNEQVALLTPRGLRPFRVVGALGGLEPLTAPQSRVALVPLAALQRAFALEGRIGLLQVTLADGADEATVRAALSAVAPDGAFVQRPQEEAANLAQWSRGLRSMLLLASLMSLVAAGFLIANNVLAAVAERGADLALLRALGVAAPRLRRWLLLEAAALASAGALLGTGVGVLMAHAVARAAAGWLWQPELPPMAGVELHPPVLLLGPTVGVAIALLAALPAVRAGVGPAGGPGAAALRRAQGGLGPGERSPAGGRRALALGVVAALALATLCAALPLPAAGEPPAPGGPVVATAFGRALGGVLGGALGGALPLLGALLGVLAAAALLPALLAELGTSLRNWAGSPLWLQLAADSVRQHRRRTGAVAASLMVTSSVLVGVFGVAGSYRHSLDAWVGEMFGWDLMVSSGMHGFRAAVPFDAAFGAELEATPGVALASPERAVVVGAGPVETPAPPAPAGARPRLAGAREALTLYAFEMADAPRLRRFTTTAGVTGEALPAALDDRRVVAVSAALAPLMDLGVGDALTLDTPSGIRSYPVVALVEDAGALAGAVYLDHTIYAADWLDPTVDSFALRLEPDAAPGWVAAALRARFAGRFPLQVVSAAAFRDDAARLVQQTFGLSQGLVVTAVLVALFGSLNALLIGAWQLRHQLAVLRALGAPVGLLSRTLMAEAWLTAGLGALVGVVMGTVVSVALFRGLRAGGALAIGWAWPYGGYKWLAALALGGALAALTLAALHARRLRRRRLAEALRHA